MPIDYASAQAHYEAYDTSKLIDVEGIVWGGPIENCDVCSRPMASEKYMIDGPGEKAIDPKWGNLCVLCAFKHCPMIGWGKAQLYKRQGIQWHLIAGGPPPEIDYE
jgi:hypothetical protein